MEQKTMMIIGVFVVAIALCGAGFFALNNNKKTDTTEPEKTIEPREVTIVDSLGNEITLQAPVTKLCTVNTNAAEFLKMLGVEKRVVGADSSTIKSLGKIYAESTDIGDYKTPSGEKIVSTGSKVVISQSSSRSLSEATEQALKDNYGITVLRIDCYGETMHKDVQEILKILISEDANKKYEEYKKTYDEVVSKVKSTSASITGDPSFLMMFTSMSSTKGTYYNVNSELGKIVASIHGHNALTDMGVAPGKGVSSSPEPEVIYDYDTAGNLDYVFIRSVTGSTAAKDFETFIKSGGSYNFNQLNVVKNKKVFLIETDVLSGPRDYIGYVCIASAYGINTGLNYDTLVSEFNEKYGFEVTYEYILKNN